MEKIKNTIWIIPIEPIDQRYTAQWYENIPKLLKSYNEMNVVTIDGNFTETSTTPGAFLDFGKTNEYKASQIVKDQIDCMGCLSQCLFSNWSQGETGTTGKKADPRSFCIQKTLQKISHGFSNLENEKATVAKLIKERFPKWGDDAVNKHTENRLKKISEISIKKVSMLGLVSRRDAEKLINAKKIRINGEFARVGQKIFINDVLLFENKKYVITNKLINTKIQLLAYHKRYGEIVTKKTIQTNNTVFENLPKSDSKWINIGRLDVNSTGLLLFTNSGDLAHKLMHPSSRIIRIYNVCINGIMDKSDISKSLSGLDIGNGEVGKLHTIKYKERDNIYEVSLMTGKNREIRRIFNTLGFRVTILHRIKYGDISLDALKPGKTRYIKSDTSNLFFY